MMGKMLSLTFLVFAVVYLLMARQLSFGGLAAPKAGFLPTLAGIAACFLAAAVIAGQLRRPKASGDDGANWRRLLLVVAGLIAYVMLLALVGYPAATFFIMLYLLKVTETAGWLYPCLIAAGVAGCFYGLFASILGINLP